MMFELSGQWIMAENVSNVVSGGGGSVAVHVVGRTTPVGVANTTVAAVAELINRNLGLPAPYSPLNVR